MTPYKQRPNDGSQKAWDYIERVYGKIKELQIFPNCCGPHVWTATLTDGKKVTVDSVEVIGGRNKT